MKEYKVDVFDAGFKTKKSFEEAFQKLIDERVSQVTFFIRSAPLWKPAPQYSNAKKRKTELLSEII